MSPRAGMNPLQTTEVTKRVVFVGYTPPHQRVRQRRALGGEYAGNGTGEPARSPASTTKGSGQLAGTARAAGLGRRAGSQLTAWARALASLRWEMGGRGPRTASYKVGFPQNHFRTRERLHARLRPSWGRRIYERGRRRARPGEAGWVRHGAPGGGGRRGHFFAGSLRRDTTGPHGGAEPADDGPAGHSGSLPRQGRGSLVGGAGGVPRGARWRARGRRQTGRSLPPVVCSGEAPGAAPAPAPGEEGGGGAQRGAVVVVRGVRQLVGGDGRGGSARWVGLSRWGCGRDGLGARAWRCGGHAARDNHDGSWVIDNKSKGQHRQYLFKSPTQRLQLSIYLASKPSLGSDSVVKADFQQRPGLKGPGLSMRLSITEGQSVTFVLHSPETKLPESLLETYLDRLEQETASYWRHWIGQCTFRGHYREQVERSLLVLKLLTYKPTGAIVAAPTFYLPESIGGARNWDYRYSWVRDAAFVVYVFLKNGYPKEAEAYINFIFDRVFPPIDRNVNESEPFLPIMVTIRGDYDIPESELDHLEGYKGSKPVRIGNGAASHKQLDIYGELMDSVYLYNKHGNPISYEQWLAVRRMISHVVKVRNEPDRSIWEVRGGMKNFVYSKIMLWVAMDRALRLAEKRSNLPCPERIEWLRVRDELYDQILTKGYSMQMDSFCMNYEDQNRLDAAVLIAPLVFFIAPNDPRFIRTLQRIMLPSSKGGLSVANMVSRYDHTKVNDGISPLLGSSIMIYTLT
ncbi:hypothetical protein AWENTII_002033 [Aspergillus wentii]